jgi:hypothetical protein
MFGYVIHLKQVMCATVIIIFATPCPWQNTDMTETEIVATFGFVIFLLWYCIFEILVCVQSSVSM